jgi:hypothetical protein
MKRGGKRKKSKKQWISCTKTLELSNYLVILQAVKR